MDEYINKLLGADGSRPRSVGPGGVGSPAGKGSQPGSVFSGEEAGVDHPEGQSTPGKPQSISITTQTLSTAPISSVYEFAPSPVKEVFTYSKGVQTTGEWGTQTSRPKSPGGSEDEDEEMTITSPSKRQSRRDREREEELRENIRREIEEELKATRDLVSDGTIRSPQATQANFPARNLTSEELQAVTSSDDFMDFVERSSKVIERALDQEYDVLADYTLNGLTSNEDEQYSTGKGRRGIREVAQFYDERWSKKRMVSDLNFSPKFPELLLASYTKNPSAPHEPDGLVQVWNMHLHDRPEFVFHAQSDVLTAKFSPFHPNLIVGGCYSGQVLLWDTRAKSSPVQKTPLTGSGHTHPVYSIDIIGTQNANNILTTSTDGVVCSWSVDMLALPQEHLLLTTPPPSKTEDLSPTAMAFPQTDPTYFLVGTEEGTIYPCHRYDRAGAKAGVDQRISYKGHAAPIMSLSFHPARGPVDLSDLLLSASLDWSVKLWRIRAPAAISSTGLTSDPSIITPLLDLSREDVIYDARWSPLHPSIFSVVDGSGSLEIWDLNIDTEVPVAKTSPSLNKKGSGAGGVLSKSLNKVAWEETEGKRIATAGIDGVVTVFEVGSELGGKEGVRGEEWGIFKKTVSRLEGGNAGGGMTNGH